MTKVHLGARKNRETAGIPVVSSSRTHAILLGVEHGIHCNRRCLLAVEIISEHAHAEKNAAVQILHPLLFVWFMRGAGVFPLSVSYEPCSRT